MEPKVTCLAFNDVQDCFVCGLDTGLRVYNTDPLVEKINLDLKTVGSVKVVAMLHRTNLIAIVGGGRKAKFATNSLLIWDDLKKQFIIEITFESPVLNVKMTYSRLVAVLQKNIYVFSFPEKPTKIGCLDTRDNPKGLCELSSDPSQEYLIFPGYKMGSVQICDLKQLSQSSSVSPVTINAHQSEIACLAINRQGTILATASVKGTLIRLYDLQKKVFITELRRGTDPANLFCIKFSDDSSYLCASSDKGTIHIFGIRDLSLNRRSALDCSKYPPLLWKFTNAVIYIFLRNTFLSSLNSALRLQNIGVLGSYAESQWALARFTGLGDCACICGFGTSSQSVIAVCMDGTFHKILFAKDGTCNREGFEQFLNVTEDQEFWNSYK